MNKEKQVLKDIDSPIFIIASGSIVTMLKKCAIAPSGHYSPLAKAINSQLQFGKAQRPAESPHRTFKSFSFMCLPVVILLQGDEETYC